jgi:GntR family transcriptional repressor for pyruvate dehydrogenase complex
MFNPVEVTRSAVESCEHAIRGHILSGKLAAGDVLPPERKLADMFRLNRLTIRSALSRLAARGLLTVRQGSGYRVEDFREKGGPDLLNGLFDLAMTTPERLSMIGDLLRIRRCVARAILETVASKPDFDSTRVDAAIEHFAELVEKKSCVEAIAEGDIAVIRSLIESTERIVFALVLNPITAAVTQLEDLRHAVYKEPQKNLMGYQVLQYWLKAPLPDAIEPLMMELALRDEATMRQLEQGVRS